MKQSLQKPANPKSTINGRACNVVLAQDDLTDQEMLKSDKQVRLSLYKKLGIFLIKP